MAVESKQTVRLRRQLARAKRDLRELTHIGMDLMHEHDLTVLLTRIVALAKGVTRSDACLLFLADIEDSASPLVAHLLSVDSIPRAQWEPISVPIDDTTIAGHSAKTKRPIVVDDAYELPSDIEFVLNRSFDERFHYRRRSMLFVPMVDHSDRLVGLLLLANRKSDRRAEIHTKEDADRFVLPYRKHDVLLARSLAGQAAVSIENVSLYAQIQHMLEAMVEAAVSAIDERDPVTAGHSLRVAELTTRLAHAVDRADGGPYRGVRLSADQIRELRFAALLHDVGKLVIPEDVLLKAKKLPPLLWERVDARFDYIRRTLELEQCRTQADGDDSPSIVLLDQMRAVTRAANEPTVTEHAPPEELREIARCTFVGPNGHLLHYLTHEELHFLELQRGTLDATERAAVEHHVQATYNFLQRIPWTRKYKNVPLFAYGHHEKLDGSGYPRHLVGDEIPLQTRMLTIADMYDALTQADRPYKPAVPIARALDILQAEARAGRIDAELVRIMIESKAYEVRSYRRARAS